MAIKLTGRRRYRISNRMFRAPKLVLQVEYEGYVMEWDAGGVDTRDVKGWRDAELTDLTEEVS